MRNNLNQLRTYFLAVREKNLTRAAERLGITQPAVSIQIKLLEDALGMKLIKKCGKNFHLTEVGDVLYGYAERIFGIVEEMEYALKGYTKWLRVPFNWAPPTVSQDTSCPISFLNFRIYIPR